MATTNIRFSSQLKAEFANELRTKVKEYFDTNEISKTGNFSIVAKSLFMLALYTGPFILMLTGVFDSVLISFISWFIMGVGMAGLGMVAMHDANHGSFAKNSIVNRWLSKSLYFLGGFPPTWRHQHNTMHHRFTNIDGFDEDIATIGLLRFSPHKPLKKVHKYQHLYAWFFYGLMTISWSTNKDFSQLSRYKRKEFKIDKKRKYSYLYTDLIISKVIYWAVSLVLPLIFMSIGWYWIVLGFLLMHFISGFILGIIFQTAHVMPDMEYPLPSTEGNIENNWIVHQLETTTNYAPKNRVLSWLIGGLNHQVEHHLFPTISHVHYYKLSAIVQRTTSKYEIPYHVQPTFYQALSQHFKMLKALGR